MSDGDEKKKKSSKSKSKKAHVNEEASTQHVIDPAPAEAKGPEKRRKKEDVCRVRVAVRIRPFDKKSDKEVKETCVAATENTINIFNEEKAKDFTFDAVFDGDKNQEDVYAALGKEMLEDAFGGYNTCIFAYGQTGSGKTYSMLGPPNATMKGDSQSYGLLPRIVLDLFQEAENRMSENPRLQVKIQVSFLEVYNEVVHDLLQFERTGKRPDRANLEPLVLVDETKHKRGFVPKDLTKITVTSWERVKQYIDSGTHVRAKNETQMNEVSSRSHSIFSIYVQQSFTPPSELERDKMCKINIVDLAGSERRGKTNAKDGKVLQEADNINQSLSVLGRCLTICSEDPNGTRHLPTRESELTKLLSDIFGGNTKTTMFAAISPSMVHYGESLQTLTFANGAKKITNKAKINENLRALEDKELKEQLCIVGKALAELKARNQSEEESLKLEIGSITNEKNIIVTGLQQVQAENQELTAILNAVMEENRALREGRKIESSNYDMPPPVVYDVAGSAVPALEANFSNEPLHTSRGPGERSYYSDSDSYYSGRSDNDGSVTSRTEVLDHRNSPYTDSSDSEDENEREQNIQLIYDILAKKLPQANPSIPETARGERADPLTARSGQVQNEIRTYTGHQGPVYCCSLSPKGDRMVSGSKDGTVKVWDVKTADEIVTFNKHKGYVLFCVFHPTKNHILSCSDDKQIKIWDIDTGKKIFSLSGHSEKVYCCVYSPSGNEVASASSDKTIRLWSSESGKKLLTLRGHTSAVFGVCFGNDPSQKMLCSASDDKTVKLWDWGEQKEVLSFQGHTGTVWSCMFSQNDSQVLSASMDGTVKIWDTKAGTCYKTFKGHTSPVHYACFARNDTRIVSASRDKSLKVWEIESGRVLTTLMGHQLTVYHCSVFNSLILSCSSDGTLKVWNMK